ncbi:hypothetical protein PsYK624_084220 [Phanerochaete sordida]|uniref:Uncharacterized protein n=1 Tax=Phanerochaete sordida TaxID=48140 RepID=A0A9P3GA77_9APHY|nr:hypothetical protein PsYK624_084220 [Phanerochaete sordida]
MHHMASVARRPRPLLAMRGTRKGPHTRTHLRLLQLQLSGERRSLRRCGHWVASRASRWCIVTAALTAASQVSPAPDAAAQHTLTPLFIVLASLASACAQRNTTMAPPTSPQRLALASAMKDSDTRRIGRSARFPAGTCDVRALQKPSQTSWGTLAEDVAVDSRRELGGIGEWQMGLR